LEISLILLLSVAVYPMGALAGTLMPSLLGALGRRMREEEDPREAAAWMTMAISAVALALSASVLPRIGDSDIVQVAVGDWGILVDRTGALGLVLVSMLGVLAGAVMLPQLSGESPPQARVLLACGFAALGFMARDARQAVLCIAAMLACLAVALGRGADRAESRRAAWRFVVACLPGVVLLGWAVLSSASRAGLTDMSLIKQVIAGESEANIKALRALTAGAGLLLSLPLLPWFSPDLLSRRPMGATVAAYGIGAVAVGWTFTRCAYGLFPWAEGWELARRGWMIPALALPSAGFMVAACLARSPSAMVSWALAAQGLWIPLAFATGGRAQAGFGAGVALSVAVPLARVAILAVTSAGREAMSGEHEGASRVHRMAAWGAAVVLGAGALWLPWRFMGWWRLLALLLLAAPSACLCVRVGRFAVAERMRRGPLYATIGAIAAAVAAIAVIPSPVPRALAGAVESDLGLHERFMVGPDGAPPPVNAPGAAEPQPIESP